MIKSIRSFIQKIICKKEKKDIIINFKLNDLVELIMSLTLSVKDKEGEKEIKIFMSEYKYKEINEALKQCGKNK